MKPGMFDNLLPPLPPSIEERLAAGDKEALIGGKRARILRRVRSASELPWVDEDRNDHRGSGGVSGGVCDK
jgi:hypothetical protein